MTMPKLLAPPFKARKRSELLLALALRRDPDASTSCGKVQLRHILNGDCTRLKVHHIIASPSNSSSEMRDAAS